MIDTSKYEGVKGSLVHSISNEEWKKLSPAAQALVADAPLLLQEVKQLREGIKQLIVKVEGMSTGYRKPIVKALKEMIE